MSTASFPLPGEAAFSAANSLRARRSLLWVSALLLALFVFASVALVHIARSQNQAASQQSLFYVNTALENRRKSLLASVLDYAFWGDAYGHLHADLDLDWAYARKNLGPTLFDHFGYEALFVVDARGNTAYAVIDGELQALDAGAWLQQDLAGLLAAARQAAELGEGVTRYLRLNGRPALVAAAALTTGGDPQVAEVPGPASVLLFVDSLSADELLALGRDYGISGLRLARDAADARAQPNLELAPPDGALRLRWDAAEPGHYLISLVLPLLVTAGLMIVGLTLVVLRKALVAAREMEQSYASLQAGRAALANSEERFRQVAEAASDWIWEIDGEHRLTYLSERFEEVSGHSRQAWLGRPIDELLSSAAGSVSAWLDGHKPRPGSRSVLQCGYLAGDGVERACSLSLRRIAGNAGYRGTAADITEEIQARARIEHLSQHDALTGLPNRNRMQEFLDGKLQASPTREHPLVMLSIDLDRFKPVNDALGHAAGDRVLNEVSARLRQCLREGDLVARLGGDEFTLIVTGISSQHEVERLCRRLLTRIQQPFLIDDNEVFIGASIGIALAPADGTQAEELLRYADIALYEAKEAGRDTWRFYASGMNERVVERRLLEQDLRHALRDGELCLEFQPRYRVDGQRIAGAEALVRWQHPLRGRLAPDLFIPLAEETGLIVPLSDWVLRSACEEARCWPSTAFVSVNLSPIEFKRGEVVERVRAVLEETGFPPAQLELELTESVMLDDAEGALQTMLQLKALGVRLSMDDFGTGYSSLSYLRAFPFDGLKIDRSFINDLSESEDSLAIIQAIVGLGKALTLTVTAEGVETADQLRLLLQVECEEAQGFYLGRPMAAEAFRQALRDHT
jgi:diguanylate cyclase (GGDEF)-like protein/PAS domain S-box-containing protein